MRFVLRRVGFYLVAAWAALTLNFLIPRLVPGDPASTLFTRLQGQVPPEAMQTLRETLGLTPEPMPIQYLRYLAHVLRGDLGVSIAYFPSAVSDVIGPGLLWTVLLAGVSVVVSLALGSLLGVVSASGRGGPVDSIVPAALTLAGSFPYVFVAMAALFIVSNQAGLFPSRYAYSDSLTPAFSAQFVLDVAWHLMLPAACVALVSVGGWALTVRGAMLSTLTEDYITLAEAKGLPQRRILWHYAVRNAVLPNLTTFGRMLGVMLGGQLLAEIVFAYPGLGYLLLQAIRNQDYPLLQGLFLTLALAVLGVNLIIDLLHARLDPRVRRV